MYTKIYLQCASFRSLVLSVFFREWLETRCKSIFQAHSTQTKQPKQWWHRQSRSHKAQHYLIVLHCYRLVGQPQSHLARKNCPHLLRSLSRLHNRLKSLVFFNASAALLKTPSRGNHGEVSFPKAPRRRHREVPRAQPINCCRKNGVQPRDFRLYRRSTRTFPSSV